MSNKYENTRFRSVVVRGLVVLHVTEKALLVVEKDVLDSGEGASKFKKWLPRSQIRSATPLLNMLEKDDIVELTIPRWLAEDGEFMFEEM